MVNMSHLLWSSLPQPALLGDVAELCDSVQCCQALFPWMEQLRIAMNSRLWQELGCYMKLLVSWLVVTDQPFCNSIQLTQVKTF